MGHSTGGSGFTIFGSQVHGLDSIIVPIREAPDRSLVVHHSFASGNRGTTVGTGGSPCRQKVQGSGGAGVIPVSP